MGTRSLLSYLSTLDEQVTQLANQTAPHLISEKKARFSVDKDSNANGYLLREASSYVSFVYEGDDDNSFPIPIVPERELETSKRPLAAVVKDCRFYPVDPLGRSWDDTDDSRLFFWDSDDEVTYSYVPLPEQLEKLSDELVAPVHARNYFIQALVSFIVSAQPNISQLIVEKTAAQELRSRQEMLMHFYKAVPITSSRGEAK